MSEECITVKQRLSINEVLADIQSRLKAPKGQRNNFGNYNYRSLEDILEAVKPLLNEHGVCLVFEDSITLVGDRYYVRAEAILMRDGEGDQIVSCAFAREALTKKGMDEAQITGATSSYARKYAANALFAIDDTKDADFLNKHDKDDVNDHPFISQGTSYGAKPVEKEAPPPNAIVPANITPQVHVCGQCGKKITDKVAAFSFKKYGKKVCMDCQGVPPKSPAAKDNSNEARYDAKRKIAKIVAKYGADSNTVMDLTTQMEDVLGTSSIDAVATNKLAELNDILRSYE